MAVTHISEAAAAADFAALMDRVRAGEEIVIDSGLTPVAVIRPARPQADTISETLARMEASTAELGHEPVMDDEFAAIIEERVRNRKPRNFAEWD